MHAPSLHKWHVVDFSAEFIEHHQKFAVAILIAALIAVMSSAATRLGELRLPEFGREFGTAQSISEVAKPLTRLSDPAYVHEQPLRAAAITRSLEHLLETSRVARAYAVVYEYAESKVGRGTESQLFQIFEATQARIAPRFEQYQGMSRRNWLQIQQDERLMSNFSFNAFQGYGLELQDERGVAIGYIGFERERGESSLQVGEITQLRDTATAIERGLLQSFDALEHPSSS